jgi:hypothetical protein
MYEVEAFVPLAKKMDSELRGVRDLFMNQGLIELLKQQVLNNIGSDGCGDKQGKFPSGFVWYSACSR